MEGYWIYLVMVGMLLFFLFSGLWIGFAIGIVSLIAFTFLMGGLQYNLPFIMFKVVHSYYLFALPLFILMGELLLEGGISKTMYDNLAPLFEYVPGGLLHTNVVACSIIVLQGV